MYAPLARSDYYGSSAPSTARSRQRACPPPDWISSGRATVDGSHVHQQPIGQGGAQLYPGSLATPTPQAFSVASPPDSLSGYGVDPPQLLGQVMHCDPAHIHQIGAVTTLTGASATGSLALHLLTLLDEPAPSGSPGTSRRCRGCFPPDPAFPGPGCLQLHRTAATARRGGLSPPSAIHASQRAGASWRTAK